jgi:hypothetical protein
VLNSHHYQQENISRPMTAIGNTGKVNSVNWYAVDSLHLTPMSISDLQAHLVDLHHIELKKNTKLLGILGFNVFAQFEIMLDFQNRVLVLSRVDKSGSRLDTVDMWETPYDSLSFFLKKHLIIVTGTVNDNKLRFIVDSGAELNLLDRKVYRKVLDKFTILKRVNLTGVGSREVEVLAGVLHDVQCGNQYSKSMNTLLTSLDEINDAFGVSAHGVLGYEFFSSRRVMINYQKQKLYFFHPLRP